MKITSMKLIGIVVIFIIGVIHLIMLPGEYEEALYMGVLFGFNFLGSIIAAVAIYRNISWGWILGFIVAIGSLTGYILSRTVGLPGMEVEEWINPYGLMSLIMEAVFIVLVLRRSPWKEALTNRIYE